MTDKGIIRKDRKTSKYTDSIPEQKRFCYNCRLPRRMVLVKGQPTCPVCRKEWVEPNTYNPSYYGSTIRWWEL